MQVKFKKMYENSVLPSYAEPGAAGLDCVAAKINMTKQYIEYDLGFAVEIPDGHVGYLVPRSSVSKKELTLANSVGVIDSSYRGVVSMRFKYPKGFPIAKDLIYEVGDRVGQIMILPIPKVQVVEAAELSTTQRGDGSYGSTGK